MQTSLCVPNLCGKVIEAIVSPEMRIEHNVQLVAKRFQNVYQSRSIVFASQTTPRLNLETKMFEKVEKERLASLVDRFVS